MACNAIIGATAPCCGRVNRGISGTANFVDVVTTVAIAALLLGAFKVEGLQLSPFQVKVLSAYAALNVLMFAHVGMISSVLQKADQPVHLHVVRNP